MTSSKIILVSTIVLLFLIFGFLMGAIIRNAYLPDDELKFFLTGVAIGFTAVALIPLSEIEKEYVPRWYEKH